MNTNIEESGMKNFLGYYDKVAKEIVLKRPCLRKKEAQEAFSWVDDAKDNGLYKLQIGVGAIESFVFDNSLDCIYSSARVILKEVVEKNKFADANLLVEILVRVEKCPDLRILSLRCFSFVNEPLMFDMLLRAIKSHKKLRILDLAGCFFEAEQLIELASVVNDSFVAHLNWPEPEMVKELTDEVVKVLDSNKSIVIVNGASDEIRELARVNRKRLFDMAKKPMDLSNEEVEEFKLYADSLSMGLCYEQQRLIELQKSIAVVLALC